ncbi:hypothetical protein GCM10008956_31670 [Deinococcus arenae]|uniref:Uncharacterized protein n=1 Tax=Deinococcus arenae TaxID=1452751 RepID=A0A8H9GUL9_9DEIO|nr:MULTISPECIES: hypothetical protein [Deinococcus]GGM53361.1 hypothetical protein GCM10008956_31670 [Deinococcus arenae]
MDLDSWTPKDKARRTAVLISSYVTMMVMVAGAYAFHWPWFVVPVAGVLAYALFYYASYALLLQYFRR